MTVKCPRCGKEYPDDVIYCSKCGVRVIRSPPHPTPQPEAVSPRESLPPAESERLSQEAEGEFKRLLELRRTYRAGAAALETELKEYALALETELKKYREEIAYRKKRLKQKYLEDLESFVFAEPSEQPTPHAAEERVSPGTEQSSPPRNPQLK
jgi:DNA-directed RNA polymerase subunit RPC12/RpoP